MTTDWRRYLDDYHRKHPAITEKILSESYDPNGEDPYDWLLNALPTSSSSFVDLACGSAPMAARLSARGSYLGVDRSAAELSAARLANPGATFMEADVLELPLGRSVTEPLCRCVVGHLNLQEMKEELRIGGPNGASMAIT